MGRRHWLAVLCGLPVAALAAAYTLLALEHRTPMLLNVVVHEDGRRTLLETILYFEHFLREVPIEIVIAWAAAIAFSASAPPPADARRSRRVAALSGALPLLMAAVAYAAAAARTGAWSAALDLLQYRTRDDDVAFGSHWHSHLHHVLGMAVTAAGIACIYRWTVGTRAAVGTTHAAVGSSTRRWWVWAAAVGGVSLALRPDRVDWNGTRLLGHAMRELVTHASVTLPLTFAALVAAEGAPSVSAPRARPSGVLRRGLVLLCLAAIFPIALLARLSGRDVLAASRQQTSLWDLLASHAFEHSIDYAFAALVAVSLYGALRRCGASRHGVMAVPSGSTAD
jgi:hypothetical protein